jgi:hypothetical protein
MLIAWPSASPPRLRGSTDVPRTTQYVCCPVLTGALLAAETEARQIAFSARATCAASNTHDYNDVGGRRDGDVTD